MSETLAACRYQPVARRRSYRGITVQVQVPWEKGPCILKLPPTDTEVTPETPTPGPGELVKGKIARLLYDGCGDFTGFVLNLCPGERSFQSREPMVERLVREACENRWSVTIVPSAQDASYISGIQYSKISATFIARKKETRSTQTLTYSKPETHQQFFCDHRRNKNHRNII